MMSKELDELKTNAVEDAIRWARTGEHYSFMKDSATSTWKQSESTQLVAMMKMLSNMADVPLRLKSTSKLSMHLPIRRNNDYMMNYVR